MEEFLNRMIAKSGINPPDIYKEAVNKSFSGAVNTEWTLNGDIYEVLFQKDGIEYIADYDLNGNLVKYKVSIGKELLPHLIKSNLEKDWEIMSIVLINELYQIIYEIVLRSSPTNRHLMIIDQWGNLMKEMRL